jgi:site-specific recombinase XerD
MGALSGVYTTRVFCHSIAKLSKKCVEYEVMRGLSERSTSELSRVFTRFGSYLRSRKIRALDDLTATTIKDFLLYTNPLGSAAQGKTNVWSMRKLFAFLALRQIITGNPAGHIPHPKARPREKLPTYLKPAELSALLESAAQKRNLQDFTVLSLLATVGPRPHEIAKLRIQDVFPEEQYLFLHVKGGWFKRTPMSAAMAETLREYIEAYAPHGPRLFYNQWKKPIDRRWIERMVRDAGVQAGITCHVTPNILRHTFATYAADRHGAVVTRALLGHCCRSHSTDVYMHLVPGKFRALMNCHPYQTTIRTPGRKP